MKITFKGDYALKAILDLSMNSQNDEIVPLSIISRRQDIPLPFLEQIMLSLKKAGYVHSRAGKGGGFFLAKRPENITLGEIIRLIEGPIEPISCGVKNQPSGCAEEGRCAFREVWVQVTEVISDIVDTVTFDQIMVRTRELQEQRTEYSYHI
ncbi:Rrf2 family transcriptional regulator [candidate division KSB1 bacterium]|nr:Rrf2 family transcriptional regulator [candidate division KSB1 bacterium]